MLAEPIGCVSLALSCFPLLRLVLTVCETELQSLTFFQAAAIAWVTSYTKVPFVAVKAVTDIVDGDRPTQEEFLENLSTAAHSLQEAVPKVLDAIADGVLS